MKDSNYYQVQGWMVNNLKLKGNELICYAIIYSFSQDEESKYMGGLKYLGSWMNASEPTVVSVLDKLCEKELIEKIEYIDKTCKRNFYRVSKESLERGNLKNLSKVSKESLVNNKKITIKEKGLSEVKPKKVGDILTPEEKEKEDNFRKTMRERYPRFMMMESPLTYKQSQELKTLYDDEEILQALEEIECWKPLLKKRVDAFRTIKNWINKNRERP